VKLCSDPKFRNAQHKIVRRAAGRGAGRPDPLLTHLHEVLLEPVLRPLAVVARGACAVHCVQDCFLAVTYLVLINLPTSEDSISNNFVELPLIIVKGVLIEVSTAHSLIHGTSGVKSKYYPFVFVYGSANSRDSL
jgi:hypothetical protein